MRSLEGRWMAGSCVGVALAAWLAFLATAPARAAANVVELEGVGYNVSASLEDNLKALVGKKVYVTLGSSQTIAGVVKAVGDHLLHLEKLDGKEFFDALIRIDRISAIDARFRDVKR